MRIERQGVGAAMAVMLLASAAQSQSQTDRQVAAAAKAAGWTAVLPSKEIEAFGGREVESVDFLTRHVGWAVGRGTTMILRTTDGGKNWERMPLFDGESHGRDFASVRFWDATHGWILGWGELLRTSDGGETWEPVQGADYVYGRSLLPLSTSVAMVGTRDGRILLTTPDGTKLEELARIDNRPVGELAFVAPNRFFAVVGQSAGDYGAIFLSTDGGESWEVAAEGDKPLFAIAFGEDGRGVAVGENVAYWTDDGGESWHRVAVMGKRHAARFLGGEAVVAVGERPGASVSRDGGRTWRPIVGPADRGRLVDIDVVDAGWWLVAGGYGSQAIHRRVDPSFRDEIARTSLPIPASIRLPGGRSLPAGMYDVSLAHDGEEHVLELERTGPAPAEEGGAATDGAAAPAPSGDAATACDPCSA
ncbi:MAG TPA: YCF48-related protein, partial [Gemmatimonadaceae bacterium]